MTAFNIDLLYIVLSIGYLVCLTVCNEQYVVMI